VRNGGWETHIERDPRDGLIVGDLISLDQLQGQFLVIELDSEDGPRRGPCPDDQVVKHCGGINAKELRMEQTD